MLQYYKAAVYPLKELMQKQCTLNEIFVNIAKGIAKFNDK